MSDVVLSVENVSKRFRIGSREPYHRFSEVLTGLGRAAVSLPRRWLAPPPLAPNSSTDPQEFWALKDVSFEVKQGEVVGIIGRNGAGKSTLLKVLSRITEPTSGRIGVRGRIGSLLEVGTGFHPELTGRENIYLNGAILGMSRAEVQRRFDEIVAFAEIDQFLDTPVKRYSSGMYVRLGFAVAAHLETEILIVDEVLAVGDAAFQRKCLGKIDSLSRNNSRTVIMVSHDLRAIRRICSNALLLDRGQLHLHDDVDAVCTLYMNSRGSLRWADSLAAQLAHLGCDRAFQLTAVEIRQNERIIDDGRIDISEQLTLTLRFTILQPQSTFRIYVDLLSDNGELLFRSFDCDRLPATRDWETGEYLCDVLFPSDLLAPLHYILQIQAGEFEGRYCLGNGVDLHIQGVETTALMPAFPAEPIRGRLSPLTKWIVTHGSFLP